MNTNDYAQKNYRTGSVHMYVYVVFLEIYGRGTLEPVAGPFVRYEDAQEAKGKKLAEMHSTPGVGSGWGIHLVQSVNPIEFYWGLARRIE